MKRILLAAATFLWVCLLGFFTALAGGVEWGTQAAGAIALSTFLIAGWLTALVLTLTAKG